MAQQNLLLKPTGLYSFPNHLSAVPQGALLKADNIVINRDSIVESRRGFKLYGTEMNGSAHQMFTYKQRIIRHYGPSAGTTLEYDSNGLGTFLPFSISLSANTHSNTTVNGITSTAALEPGMSITGAGIPINTTIVSIDSNISITISNAATATATVTLSFSWDIQEVVAGRRIRSIEQNGNLYFTSSEGIRKISLHDATWPSSPAITLAGGVKALDLTATINNNPGFLVPQSVVAYRLVWGVKDSNNNLILGAPSSRAVIQNNNTINSATVDLTTTIPKGVTTAYFYQLYRTPVLSNVNSFTITGNTTNLSTQITNASNTSILEIGMSIAGTGIPANTTITAITSTTSFVISFAATATNTGITLNISQLLNQDPGDEQQLVFESNPTIADLTAGFISITDITPETFRQGGANLYTNQNSGEGILQANDIPPLAYDIATFKGYTFYGNTTTKQRLDLSLLSVSTLVAGVSTLTVTNGTTSNTYTFDTAENVALKKILISTAATPAQQVDQTARSIVHVINGQSNEQIYAYYLSGPTDVPGLMLFEARNLNEPAFYLNVDNAVVTGQEFSPAIPISGQDVISTDEVTPNRIYYSKFQQPEAVPIVNFIDIGPQDKAILRILGLRDSLFVLKEDGIYRLSGQVAPFTVSAFDFSTNIVGPDSAVILNNLIYMYSTQGVSTISDTGVSIISRPIENDLVKLSIPAYTNFKTATFGLPYETDRAYYMFTVTNPSDVYATQCYRYNTFTNSWTRLLLSKRSGVVNPADDKLYLAPTDVNFIEQERKDFTRSDYSDREHEIVIGAEALLENSILVPSLSDITLGDVLVQYQYLTIKQYNQLLSKLDRDSFISPHNYISSLEAPAGCDLSNFFDNLVAKIRDDSGRHAQVGHTADASYTALIGTGSSSFSALQIAFNNLIDLLNTDVGLSYKNYMYSMSITEYESDIVAISTLQGSITVRYAYNWIQGPSTLYNHINTELQFVPQYFSDVSMTKQVSDGTLIFEDSSFSTAILSYASDLSGNFENQPVNGAGNGIFGNTPYGEGIYGGNGSGVPFRTLLPKEKQRCRYISVKFLHQVGREIFSLYGLSLTYNMTSSKGWR